MKILRITSSPRKGASESIKLGAAIVEKLLAANPGATVQHKDLTTHPFPHLEEAHLNAFFTPPVQHSEAQKEAIRHSDQAIAEIKDADVLVIEAPMYNFSIPSTLKAWIDHIVRAGITFNYTANGPVGLITGKKIYVAISSGGVYSEGPYKSMDFITPYLQTILGMQGMTDLTYIRAEGLSMPDLKDTALEKGIESIEL